MRFLSFQEKNKKTFDMAFCCATLPEIFEQSREKNAEQKLKITRLKEIVGKGKHKRPVLIVRENER